MATVRTNPLVNGLSGMLGSIVFKNYKGNTIVASKPKPAQTQSDEQKANRSKFKAASAWAKNALLDAATKEYYQKKAKKLKLPNAYTAAITDYMRKPRLVTFTHHDQSKTIHITKKDFDVKAVEVKLHSRSCTLTNTRVVVKNKYSEWCFKVSGEEWSKGQEVVVTDQVGNTVSLFG